MFAEIWHLLFTASVEMYSHYIVFGTTNPTSFNSYFQEQYEYLHDMASTYIEQYATYANFQ